MATTSRTGTGTSLAFSKTPQAKDDIFRGLNEDSGPSYWDVMFNDLGGNAKTLYSLDDAVNAAPSPIYSPTDLLAPDGFNVMNYSQYGAAISITAGGKVAYDPRTTAFGSAFQSLALGETGYDTFTYAIHLGNGTLSWATATVEIAGANDAPVVAAADVSGELTEMLIPLGHLTDRGTIAFTDVDQTDSHSISAITPTGAPLGTLTASVSTDTTGTGLGGVVTWNYSVAAAAVEYLVLGETKVESFSFNVLDGKGGSVSRTVDVTITGTNDAPVVAVDDVSGAVAEQASPVGYLNDSGTITFTDVDLTDRHSVGMFTSGDGTLGTLTARVSTDTTANEDGVGVVTWSYSVKAADIAYLNKGETKDETFSFEVLDGQGGSATRPVVVTITGAANTPPLFSSASVVGNTLVLAYDQALGAQSLPLPSSFTIKVNGLAQAFPIGCAVNSDEKTVTLTLATPVSIGQTVTVSYTDPTTGDDAAAIQNTAGNDAASMSDQAVTNNTRIAPLYTKASATGNTLVMSYNETLHDTNIPSPSAFTIKVNGVAQAVPTGVAVNSAAKTVTLTLATPVTHGQAVTVSYTDPTGNDDTYAIQDTVGNDAVTVNNRVVVNQTPDVIAPAFVRATVSGSGQHLTLAYDEALDPDHLPLASAFAVKVGLATPVVPTSITVNAIAGTVRLTLETAVTHGEIVTVSYTDPTAGNDTTAIQDTAGNDAVTVTDQAVTNNASDAPFLKGARVQGNTLVLTYNEALDATNIPPTSAFAIKVGSTGPVAPTNVAVNAAAKTVTLTLAAPVTSGQTVKVSYTDPTTGNDIIAIQDAAGNDAESLENQSVTNHTPPVFSGATVSGKALVLTYSDALDATNIPSASAFAVTVAGAAPVAPTHIVVNTAARTVTLTLAAPVTSGQAVAVRYADPTPGNDTAAIQNAAGNDALGLADQPVTNHTPPLLASATVSGNSLVLTYSDVLNADGGNTPLASAFIIKVNGAAQAVPTAVAVDAAAKTVTLTLAVAVSGGQVVTVSYADPTTGNDLAAIQDAAGNDASSVANRAVTNNTPDTTAPVLASATVSASTLVLTYNEALDATNEPGAGAFTVKVGGTAQDAPTDVVVDSAAKTVTLTLAAAVTHGQAVTVSYADPTGGNDSAAIQDTVGNDASSVVNRSVTNTTVNTAAPTLSVVVSAGADVNQIKLTVTTGALPAGTDRADLSFAGLPIGATVKNLASQVVTSVVTNFDGSDTFTVEFPIGSDVHQNLLVTVTGKDANGTEIGYNVQTIDLAYDVSASTEMLNFASANQNLWGNFNGYIGWHEYIPFLGGAPIVWNEATGEWDEAAAPDYWRSGEFSVIDVNLDSAAIVAAASTAAQAVLGIAKGVFDATAYLVTQGVKDAIDLAEGLFQDAEEWFYFGARTVDAAVQATFQVAKAAYDWADGLYDTASYAFNTIATGAHNITENAWNSYQNWWNGLSGWDQFWSSASYPVAWALQAAGDLAYDLATGLWNGAKYAFEVVATGTYNLALSTYNAAASLVNQAAQTTFALAEKALQAAEATFDAAMEGVHDLAQGIYDVAEAGVFATLNRINELVSFDSRLTVDADVFAQVGLQVDFELDMGSVDTDIDYQLTSTTRYNQTTDLLTITPMMTNMTTGDSVAFDTISPNAKFYAALLYDVGANFNVFVDGKLMVNGTEIYDLSPGKDGFNLQFPISTENFASALGVIAGGNIDVGKLVLLDLDTTKLEPMEVPFIEALTKDILTIEIAIPTLETEGTEATYVPATPSVWNADGTFEEQNSPFPYASIDFSEISSAFFNIINAKFDFSEEFQDQYNMDSLNGKSLADIVKDIGTGLLANIWDVLVDGQAEGVPIFVLDMTDETSSSLLHLNLFPDDVMNDTTSTNTGSFGFYAAYGESDPVVEVTLDLDAAYVAIIKTIAKAVASSATVGIGTAAHPLIDAIPNPYNLEFGIEQVLKIAAVPKAVADEVTKWVDLGFSFEVADLDVSQEVNFSQDFTLSIDDMSYLVTMEDGTSTFTFTANGTGALSIPNASTYDANGDGLLTYTLDIVPTAMFSNDTEVGLSLGYQLDFLKGGFAAGLKLPLGDLLGIENADWLNLDFSAIDISMGPLLRVQGEIDTLDVDVFESRFELDVGSDSYAGAVDVTPYSVADDVVLIGYPPTEL